MEVHRTQITVIKDLVVRVSTIEIRILEDSDTERPPDVTEAEWTERPPDEPAKHGQLASSKIGFRPRRE